jgi:serine/threonine protein kinase
MPLSVGSRLGPYEIITLIGAGGMGEVFRARDTKLGRDVALKVLPEAVASDPERTARMRREAQVLAALNHPNIAAIHGFEDSGAVHALVLEFVDGETLAERIARGPIPIDEALAIAKQIAEALEAAHEQGIIHRDLKPANIKVRHDGTVKVLDFGLAKLADATGAPAALSMSPTITSPALISGLGVLLGTAPYMSPEQARSRPVDKRSDIWAFGCVLYEMLTAKRAFAGDEVSETLASVLAREPDWTALPTTIAPAIRTLLRRCLDKDLRQRIGDIAAARFVLSEYEKLMPAVSTAAPQPSPPSGIPLWRRATTPAATLIVGSLVTGASVWFAVRPLPPRISRLTMATSSAAALSVSANDRDLAITPDGSRIVYVGNNDPIICPAARHPRTNSDFQGRPALAIRFARWTVGGVLRQQHGVEEDRRHGWTSNHDRAA